MRHLFDLYLWAQLAKLGFFVVWGLLIVVLEYVTRGILLLFDFCIPVSVQQWVTPRLYRYDIRFVIVELRLIITCTYTHTYICLPILSLCFFPLPVISSLYDLPLPRLLPKRFTAPPKHRAELQYSAPELIQSFGYPVEEHFAHTSDGFILGLHRIPHGKDDEGENPGCEYGSAATAASTIAGHAHDSEFPIILEKTDFSSSAAAAAADSSDLTSSRRPVVFVMHGFLQSSEAYLCTPNSLPYMLADAGFDVWLGNARGNKYSSKHEHLCPSDREYWDFCIDELAQKDLPAAIGYVLEHACVETLSYVGFSQGTALAFASFSLFPELAARINLFVALGACSNLNGFSNRLVDALTRCSPDVVYLVLGKKRLLPSTLFWQNILPTSMFNISIDKSCNLLFGWTMENINPIDKDILYSHLYSYSSCKAVVHWFQIQNSGRLQMYDDHRWESQQRKTYVQPGYPMERLSCPTAIFSGGRDFLPDTETLLRTIPKPITHHHEPSYEHLDFLYAQSAPDVIYPKILSMCRTAIYNPAELRHFEKVHNISPISRGVGGEVDEHKRNQ
jgi:lysosomal acid lipase/cholesteryl ester hydrolase